MSDVWFYRPANRTQPRVRLVCFAHAGGSAATYRLWPQALPDDVEVVAVALPGRGGRWREPPIAGVAGMVDALLPELERWRDRPFALFGHSMGALVAFEVAAALQRRGGLQPAHLFVSGRRAPCEREPLAPLSGLDDAAFVAEIDRRYGGIPPELRHDADIMALLLPSLRADIHAVETWAPGGAAPLACPITAYGGHDDPHAPIAQMTGWQRETAAPARVRLFPGGHFYLEAQRDALLADVGAALAASVPEAVPRRFAA
jgi:surfactin synthase thioesterase subunit